jgi:ubiquinone/menaquinone biosynthesis C-methylase UbiE
VNSAHSLICSSRWWRRKVEGSLLPWALAGVNLGDEVLEIGPGLGATTAVLARRPGHLSVIELDAGYCERLRRELGERVSVVHGDAAEMPFPDGGFSGVVCFTMLHHLPSPQLQDRLLAEVARVLAPGGVFAGSDSIGTGSLFKLLHIADTLVPVDPGELPRRIERAGLRDPEVRVAGSSFRFRAAKAAAA